MNSHQPVVSGRRSALVIPIHKELKRGTLARILREAGLHIDDLRRLLDR